MGIPGLERKLWESEGCVVKVSIPELVNRDGKNVIVVDGFQFYGKYLYSKFDWIYGDLRKLVEEVETFVEAFERIGIKLVFFFVEGHLDEGRDSLGSNSWVERRFTFIEYTKRFFEISQSRRSSALKQIKLKRPYYYTPLHVQSVVLFALQKKMNCEVKFVYPDDRIDAAAHYTRNNNCLALLAQDNYYIFFQGVPHYLSIKELKLKDMTTVKYSPQGLARLENLEDHLYPIFLDPDYVLKPRQKRRLINICHKLEEYGDADIARCKIMKCVNGENINHVLNLQDVDYKRLESDSEEELEHCTEQIERITDHRLLVHLLRYNYGFENLIVHGPLQKWKLIKLKAQELYTSGLMSIRIGQILSSKRFYNDCILEDFCELPPSSMIYLSLRKKLYGVLFHEATDIDCKKNVLREHLDEEDSDLEDDIPQPGYLTPWQRKLFLKVEDEISNDCRIEEWVMIRKGCMKAPEPYIPELVDPSLHPGLLILWDRSSAIQNNQDIQDNKWKLFSKCISMDLDSELLRKLPRTLVIPTAVLYYLYNNVPEQFENKWKFIQPWEVEVFIAQAVMLDKINVKSLSTNKTQHFNERIVKLMALFVYGCQIMCLLVEACGSPISKDDLCLWHFLDGELLHSFYENGEWKKDAAHLCDKDTLVTFLQMKNIIFPGNSPCSGLA